MKKDISRLFFPLAIGFAFLIVSYFLPSKTANDDWWRNITASAAAVFIGVSISEFFLKQVPKLVKEQREVAFDQFFGTTYSDKLGHILLQADRIDKLIRELSSDPKSIESLINEPVPSPGAKAKSNRLYEARRWVNAHDADASRSIREAFRVMERSPPELYVEDHKPHLSDGAPFIISTGLGFTENTDEVFRKVCEGWMIYDPASDCGDVVAIHQKVYPGGSPDFEPPGECVRGSYLKLLPRDWKRDEYLSLSDQLREGFSGEARHTSSALPNDYAILLRHTDETLKQVRFVVAGFTAHGTAAAGKYLADHWDSLWETYVKGHANSSDGDFCQLIVGMSEDPGSWRPAENAVMLTPRHLATSAKIECLWKSRFDQAHVK